MPRSLAPSLLVLATLVPGALAGDPPSSMDTPPIDAAWLARARARLEPELHAFAAAEDGGARAASPAHGFHARLDGGGLAVELPDGSLTLALRAFGRGDELAPLPAARLAFDAERAELTHGALVEWWTNGPAGMEQGFELPQPPAAGADGPVVLELAIGGSLAARLVDGGGAVSFRREGREQLRYSKLAAFDADGEVLDARMTLGDGAVRLEVEDAGARYPLTIDPLLSNPSWTAEGDDDFAWLGAAVSTAGDVNGDGYSDVVVGAPTHDAPGLAWAGAVFLYLGSANGLGTTWSWRAFGGVTQTEFGKGVACAGDVNGDGFDDLIVSEPRAASFAGRAYVYLGNGTGANLQLGWTATGAAPQARFGQSVAYAGDVNADGFADVVVGSPVWDFLSVADAGRADLFLGSAQGPSSAPDWSVLGDWQDGELGTSVATAGDVNGDGFDDVIVGEPGRYNGGRALVFAGGQGGLAASALWEYYPNITPGDFGWSVATAGDVNRDGYADVLVGSPQRYTLAGTQGGAVMLFLGSATGPGSQHDWWYRGTREFETLGVSVASAGDLNADGYADVIVGAPGWGSTPIVGWTRAFFGSPTGLESEPDWVTYGVSSYGSSVATAGDVNGDGFSDALVGEPWYSNGESNEGAVRVYHGSGGTPALGDDDDGPANGSGLGYSVANAGDVDGDGLSDVIVGAPYADGLASDAGYLRLYHGREDLALLTGWELHGPHAGAFLGGAVASAGDVNGDGFDDVIAGARRYSNGEVDEGAAFLFHGSPQGLGASWDTLLELDVAGAGFGNSVACAGDVNGDGYADVIVGAPFTSNANQQEHGAAFVFHGSAQGIDPVPAWSFAGEGVQTEAFFGNSVSGAGDVNGDGYSDVIVGAPYWSSGGALYAGRARVFLGSPQGLELTPSWTTPLGNAGWLAGHGVSGAGDVNGDGYSDVLVGAPGQPGNNGRVLVFHGSAAGLSISWDTLVMPYISNGGFGSVVAAAGDLDGDGFGDVIIGAPYSLSGQGRAQVQFGSASGLSPTADFLTDGGMQWGSFRGLGVGGGGDFDGDGFADLLVGAPDAWPGGADPGHIGVLAGNSSDVGLALRARRPEQRQLAGGARIALRGRAKVPGTIELGLRAHSPAGRARVRLEWQLARRGGDFTGQPTRTGAWHDTGSPDPVESAVAIAEIEDQLLYDEVYTWRARVTSANPLFPRGPWLSAAGNSPTEGKLSTRVGQNAGFTGSKKQNP